VAVVVARELHDLLLAGEATRDTKRVIVASVPLLTMRTFSQLGTRSQIASASSTSRRGAPYEVPSPAAFRIASTTFGARGRG
jgi:hypothetical protein